MLEEAFSMWLGWTGCLRKSTTSSLLSSSERSAKGLVVAIDESWVVKALMVGEVVVSTETVLGVAILPSAMRLVRQLVVIVCRDLVESCIGESRLPTIEKGMLVEKMLKAGKEDK